jgi:hypothetical protein
MATFDGEKAPLGDKRSGLPGAILICAQMTDPNEQYAYFTITRDFDPTEISNLVGVAPTESWIKGSSNPHTRRQRPFSRWSLHSRF